MPGFAVCDSAGNLKTTSKSTTSITLTTTGNIDDLDFSNVDVIYMNNASLATIRGLKAGVDGQVVRIVSKGAGEVDFSHQNTNSLAANRLINFTTSGVTPLAAGVGTAEYVYDVTTARWRLFQHEQGDFINIPYASVTFAGLGGVTTWTVDSGDFKLYQFYLIGRKLTVKFQFDTTSVSPASDNVLTFTAPSYSTVASEVYRASGYFGDNSSGAASAGFTRIRSANPTKIEVGLNTFAAWQVSTNNTYTRGDIEYEVS